MNKEYPVSKQNMTPLLDDFADVAAQPEAQQTTMSAPRREMPSNSQPDPPRMHSNSNAMMALMPIRIGYSNSAQGVRTPAIRGVGVDSDLAAGRGG